MPAVIHCGSDEATRGDVWRRFAIGPQGTRLGLDGKVAEAGSLPADGPAWLFLTAAHEGAALLVAQTARVLVNGIPVAAGLCMIGDKDEIRLGRNRFYLALRDEARVEPFPHLVHDGPACCPRCNQPLAAGDPAVRCPGCGTWFHQHAGRECFTYGDTCPICRACTTLGGDCWTPTSL